MCAALGVFTNLCSLCNPDGYFAIAGPGTDAVEAAHEARDKIAPHWPLWLGIIACCSWSRIRLLTGCRSTVCNIIRTALTVTITDASLKDFTCRFSVRDGRMNAQLRRQHGAHFDLGVSGMSAGDYRSLRAVAARAIHAIVVLHRREQTDARAVGGHADHIDGHQGRYSVGMGF